MLIGEASLYPKGFTLIELLFGISITLILLTIGVPAFKSWSHNVAIRNAAESALSGLQLARTEAVRRNTNTRLTLDGTSTSAWTVEVEGGPEIQSRPAGESSGSVTNITHTPAGALTVTFDRLGRVVPNTPSSLTLNQIEFDVPASLLAASQSRELRIVIGSGGQIRMCNPGIPSTNPQGC